MSTMLDTGHETEFRQHPYLEMKLTRFEGVFADVSDAGNVRGLMKEMHNWRFEQPDTPVTRTGYRRFPIADLTPPPI